MEEHYCWNFDMGWWERSPNFEDIVMEFKLELFGGDDDDEPPRAPSNPQPRSRQRKQTFKPRRFREERIIEDDIVLQGKGILKKRKLHQLDPDGPYSWELRLRILHAQRCRVFREKKKKRKTRMAFLRHSLRPQRNTA